MELCEGLRIVVKLIIMVSSSENDKLNWIFDVYDKNCGGTIDPEV